MKTGNAELPVKNQQCDVPLAHYQGLYESLDPRAVAERCGLSFEATRAGEGFFLLRLMGTEYRAAFPVFELRDLQGDDVREPYEKILLIRYLCEGKFFESRGKRLSYNEIPWGPTYYRNFEGRCLKRAAHSFGNDLAAFRRMVEGLPGLRFEALDTGDAGYRFEFLNGLFISLLIWAGDDEFPPSAQMLFDDNFIFAFTAEDLAAMGEVVIRRFKEKK
ncbi:DUF3786 domain-containing protein [Treponema primitia]|uniref:DUF3786 domain-containing protein n=1 Tax=Treponema primitia TaxID=88058 RepID=UPI0039817F4D